MTTSNARAEVLRAAGHRDAADLLESLDRLEQPAAPTTTEAPTQPSPATTAEEARQQEGAALLAQLRRSCPDFLPDPESAA